MQQVTVEHTKFGYQVRVDGELVASKGSKAEADEIAGRLRSPGGLAAAGIRDIAPVDGATLAFIAEEGDTADDGTPIPSGTEVFEVEVDPEAAEASARLGASAISVLLAGNVDAVKAALATGEWDSELGEVDRAERDGKDRKGVHEAIAARWP